MWDGQPTDLSGQSQSNEMWDSPPPPTNLSGNVGWLANRLIWSVSASYCGQSQPHVIWDGHPTDLCSQSQPHVILDGHPKDLCSQSQPHEMWDSLPNKPIWPVSFLQNVGWPPHRSVQSHKMWDGHPHLSGESQHKLSSISSYLMQHMFHGGTRRWVSV